MKMRIDLLMRALLVLPALLLNGYVNAEEETLPRKRNVQEVSMSPKGIVSIKRGIDSSSLESIFTEETACEFSGNIVLGGPSSLEQDDKFFAIGSRQLTACQLMVDYINRFRCGVNLNSGNYALELRSYDDQSSTEWTSVIGNKLVSEESDVDVLLGGYSSTLTKPLSAIANENSKLLMAPGAAATSVFTGMGLSFGTFPPTAKYIAQAIEALSIVGAKTIATIWEEALFTRGVCAAAPDLAQQYGLEVTSTRNVTASPALEELEPLAQTLKDQEDPDVVITCVYDCIPWMKAMRAVNWSPRAQVFTVCVGLHDFTKAVEYDAEYIMGVTPWDASMRVQDEVTDWSASDFSTIMRKEKNDLDVTYHSASAASVISITVQAIENLDIQPSSWNNETTTLLADYIATNFFPTVYGNISFDLNGQSRAPSLLIQYDNINTTVQTIYPYEASSGPILYPMPTWDKRDCIRVSSCATSGNACDDEGKCVCTDSSSSSTGQGVSAQCVPDEDMNYINRSLVGIGSFLFCILFLMAIGGFFWIYKYRDNTLVKVSQPIFLALILAGTIFSSLSIIPMGIQTSYRDTSSNIKKVDAACMAVPWLWGLGFAITFSALFAKVWRVKKLHNASANFRQEKIMPKDVAYIMVIMVVIETIILMSFSIASPQRWQREVVRSVNGVATESIGMCTSENGWWFYLALVTYNISCLFYALILCFQTKDLPSDFAESNHIFLSVMFMFQILLLGIPVSAMIRDEPNVFYFTRVGIVFFLNLAVLVIIFAPKMIRIYKGQDSLDTIRAQLRSSVVATKSTSNAMGQQQSWRKPSSAKSTSESFAVNKDKSETQEDG